MTSYQQWRETEVKRVGGKMQREAETRLDCHDSQPVVDVCDDKVGQYARYKADVAEVYQRHGRVSPRRFYTTVSIAFDTEGNVIYE